MKTQLTRPIAALALLALSILDSQLSSVFAQGSLAPPGAPAASMKSLDQIEPRTPISSAPCTISAPGSYYLTANLHVNGGDAIDITASGVTLDLNGFTLSSSEATPAGTGINLAGANTDITILNGHIQGGVTYGIGGVYGGAGFRNGIGFSYTIPANVRVSGVSVSGCAAYGIKLNISNSTVVDSCTVQNIGVWGIQAGSISHSVAELCGDTAIFAATADSCYGNCTGSGWGLYSGTANNCSGLNTGSGTGLSANNANNCYGQANGNGDGLDALTANNCQGSSGGSGTGVRAGATATGCYGHSGTGAGLSAMTANNCQGQADSDGDGLDATTASNCQGHSNGHGNGLNADQTATGCYGYTGTGIGLSAGCANGCSGQSDSGDNAGLSCNIAINCYGTMNGTGSGTGLSAGAANNCQGTSNNGTGLWASTASSCFGSSVNGTGLTSNYGNFSFGFSLTGTPVIIYYTQYNMP